MAALVAVVGVSTSHGAAASKSIYPSYSARRSDGHVADRTVTLRYLEIVRATLVAEQNNTRAVDSAIDKVVTNVRRRCPVVAVHAPVNLTRWRVEAIISEELAIAGIHADATATSKFLKRVMGLHWHDQQVTNRIQEAARAVSTQSRLDNPELCASLRRWSSSGFYGVPRDLAAFSRRVESLSEMSNLLPNILVKHEFGAGGLRELRQLERVVGTGLRTYILHARAQILSSVGMSK